MNTETQLRLNNIKNRLQRHQPLAPDDLQWLINTIENIDLDLERMTQKHNRLKDAVNKSQIEAIQNDKEIRRAMRNGEK